MIIDASIRQVPMKGLAFVQNDLVGSTFGKTQSPPNVVANRNIMKQRLK
jgi:hypothetical protein